MPEGKLAPALRPKKLGPRGNALWRALTDNNPPDAARALLIGEACRLADRLDKLHALISGDETTWARVHLPKNESELVLRIDSAVTEARQTTNVLRQMLSQLDVGGGTASEGGSFLDRLAANTADRIAAASAQ